MTEIEKIQRYIERYGAPHNPHYDMGMNEVFTVVREMGPVEAVSLAFVYGKAKSYQAAKKEAQA